MPVQNLKYCEYFDVNEKYFPCIDLPRETVLFCDRNSSAVVAREEVR